MITDTSGIILLNKPAKITSFRALGGLKKSLREFSGSKVKVGHTGTLDSFAEGLLVVLTGKFTKLNQIFTGFDKAYEANIIFGIETDTLDPEGKIINTAGCPSIETINEQLVNFSGRIKQRPPVFSAVHVNGERAYKMALKGKIQELPERDVQIYSFDIISWDPPELKCRIFCSKGTYIRSIARDLGTASGSCAHLGALKRIRVGPFSVDESISPDSFKVEKDIISGKDLFKRLSSFDTETFGIIEAKKGSVEQIRHGENLKEEFFISPPRDIGKYAVFDDQEFVAYIDFSGKKLEYIFVG